MRQTRQKENEITNLFERLASITTQYREGINEADKDSSFSHPLDDAK